MWYFKLSVILVLSFAVDVKPQFFEILNYLNNVTVSDLGKVLRWIPLPNPILFDGKPVRINDVTFDLYTRRNPDRPEILKRSSTLFNYLDPSRELKILIHGWLEDSRRPYYRELIDAYLKRGDYNVIGVSWEIPARTEYTIAARNTKTSGRALGDFIIRLNKLTGLSFKQVHILGHSLGAHLAGFAGRRVRQRTGIKIARISALDAAGPLFEIPLPVGRNHRLDKTDAEFVDCVHTDGGVFGMTAAFCDADFYPNGGTPRQPGCDRLNIQQLSTRVIIDDMFCSHYKSHEFYAESINSNGFMATLCNTYQNYRAGLCQGRATVPMGENTPVTTRGTFFLTTNANKPYARS